ncbi:MAG: hypothetical protein ACI87X_001073 [Candidatus Arcticimaribacter sp.]|jgi:hypothetical protein|tara:strand:+ start:960 stop:1604 length:645 start_codon:yes stop_codon:yes gene_type:complete
MKIASQVLLWILIVFFSFKIYDSINGPINFNETKNERYADVISRLKEIRKAQIAHKDVRGFYANNFDSLVSFIDTGIFTLVQKRDSSYLEYDKVYRIDMLKEVIVTDTLGFIPVKDSLFRNIDYTNLSKVPVDGIEAVFSIKADIIKKNDYRVAVFEVRVSKNTILHDQNKDLLKQENETVSVDGVNGPAIILGSLTDVSENGNWPSIFDAPKQ